MGGREESATVANLSPIPFTPEERAEFEQWQQLGHEAWAGIDEWEREAPLPQLGESHGT